MITVDCKDILPIQYDLLVYVSDNIKAIPAIKGNEFVLSPIDHDEKINFSQVKKAINEYLNHIGEKNNFFVTGNSDKILINSVNGWKINKITPPVKSIGSCCGI